MNHDLHALTQSMRSTDAFLAEWQDKVDHQLLKSRENAKSNYIVLKDGRVVVWARTIDINESMVTLHSREELISRMGEEQIRHLEASLLAPAH